jgi:hypothetical protein
MSVYTVAVGCPACRASPTGHCEKHSPGRREGLEADLSSGQRRYYEEGRHQPAGELEAEFDLQAASDEPAHRHGPLVEAPAGTPVVWLRRAPMPPRRDRASKGWRRHLRRAKAETRIGRSSGT